MITQPALHATGRRRVTLCDVPTLPPAHLARDNGSDCPEASIERTPVADHEFGFRTQALHAGAVPDAVHGSRAVPIHQTSSFVFESAEDAANLFALQKYGNIYSRIGNPTVAAFEVLAKHDENYMPPEVADATNGMHFKPEYTEAQLQGAKQ